MLNPFFCRRSLLVGSALAFCLSLPLQAMTLEQALSLAEQQAPSLQAWRLNELAVRSEAQAAGQLPDPKLALGLQNVPIEGDQRGRLNADGMTMQMIGLMQEVPNSARRQAQRELAGAAVERVQAEYQVERLNVRLEVAEAWLRLHALQRQLALFDEFYAQNDVLAASIAARLAGGLGPLAVQPLAALERARLDQRRDLLLSEQEVWRAQLRRWLGAQAPAQTLGNWPQWPLDLNGYRARLALQPELAQYRPLAREREAAVRLAEADRRPDWGWELAYQRRGMGLDDMFSVQVSVGLPLFSGRRQQPRIAAREAELAALDRERDSAWLRLENELEVELSQYRRLELAQARSTQQMLPLAEQRAELALADYRGGRAELDGLIDARRELIETRLQHVELEAARAISHTRLHLTWGEH